MMPSEYSAYFMTHAAVAATLFGLIFLVISIAPESVITASAPMERQAKAGMAYIALANPLIISLFALVPQQQVGIVVISVGLFGFLNTIGTALALLKNRKQWSPSLRNSVFIMIGFVLFSFEIYAALLILRRPSDADSYLLLANLLVVITLFGIARAWDLIGVRRFGVRNWISSLGAPEKISDTDQHSSDPTS